MPNPRRPRRAFDDRPHRLPSEVCSVPAGAPAELAIIRDQRDVRPVGRLRRHGRPSRQIAAGREMPAGTTRSTISRQAGRRGAGRTHPPNPLPHQCMGDSIAPVGPDFSVSLAGRPNRSRASRDVFRIGHGGFLPCRSRVPRGILSARRNHLLSSLPRRLRWR